MSRDKVLPPKMSIKVIQNYLNMVKFPLDTPHQQLCDHVNGKNFDLHLKSNQLDVYQKHDVALKNGELQIKAGSTPVKSIKGELVVNSIKYNPPPSLFGNSDKNPIDTRQPYIVDEIRDQGIEYYITEPGSNTVGISFTENEFYAQKDEIINFRKEDIYRDTLDKSRLDTQLLNDTTSGGNNKELPHYLDPESEYYSEELHLAIQAHEAIHITKYGNQSFDRKNRVYDWLNDEKSNLNVSEAAITRIAATISLKRKKRK